MTRLVVTADGIVGRRAAQYLQASLRRAPERRDPRRTSFEDLAPGDVVVAVHPGPHTDLASTLLRAGVHVVSVDDDLDGTCALLELDDLARDGGAAVVVGAGMSPGLTGLLARQLAASFALVDEIHVAIHGTAGPECARQHHRALGGRAVGWHDGEWIERPAGSGRELCWFPEPVGPYDCYRAELAGPLLLQRTFPTVQRVSARSSATRRDRFTARLPMLRPPHPEGGIGAVRVEVRGAEADGARITSVAGIAELVGTASAATAAVLAEAALAGELPAGVVVLGDERLPTSDLLDRIARHGVRLQEFTGVPHV